MVSGDDDFPETDGPHTDDRDVVDAGSAEGQIKAERQRKRREKRQAEFVVAMLKDPDGRAFFWDLLSEAGAFQTPFQCGPNGFPQPEASWFRAGQQAFALGLYHRLMALDFDGVRLMLGEFDSRFKKVSR